MLLKKIRIKNLGAFASESEWIELGGQMATIIGENGTGKSTILFAINLLLDKKTRRKGVSTNWIPKSDTTIIEYVFDASKFREIGVALPIEEDNQIHITVELQLNEDMTIYFPNIIIGKEEKIKYSYMHSLPFDRHIEIIHIKPNIENNITDWIEKAFQKKETFDEIKNIMNTTNNSISKIQEINEFEGEIKTYLSNIITMDSNFDIAVEANIQLSKISKSLNIFHTKNGKRVVTHGEGYKKILSILSNVKKTDDKKIKLIIIDELENHFFYIYQSKIINYLSKLVTDQEKTNTFSQIIIVTHSPNIVKITPKTSITKLRKNCNPRYYMYDEKKQYYIYQKELASAIFYDKILIVEGHSEKFFFEYLIKYNKNFKDICNSSEIFVLNNQGCNFQEILLLLQKLSSKVVVLTDNDIWGSQNPKYEGIKRIKNLLPDKIQNKYQGVKFSIDNNDNNELLKQIINDGKEHNIFTQERKIYGCKEHK